LEILCYFQESPLEPVISRFSAIFPAPLRGTPAPRFIYFFSREKK